MVNISIIIPNLNGGKILQDCCLSLLASIKNCSSSKFEIILVDNHSTDNSLEIFRSHFPSGLIIQNTNNPGFGYNINQGINRALYDYVCLLNNDLIIDSDFFVKVISEISENYAAYCGTILNNQLIESQGISFNPNGSCLQNNHQQIYLPNFPSYPVWGSSGAAVIYNKTILKKIGLFDQHYFFYIEDVDLSYRLNKNGYYTKCIPEALVWHLGGTTSNKIPHFRAYYTFRNWIRFLLKNYSTSELLYNFPSILLERLHNLSYLLKSYIK